AAMHAVDVEDGGTAWPLVLRRWARTDVPPDVGVVENEAATLGLLASAPPGLPAPRLIASDAAGGHADVPAVGLAARAGRDTLPPAELDPFLRGLAETARVIHAVPVPEGVLNYFRVWGLDTVVAPPAWTKHPDVWEEAITIANQPVPEHDRVFVHRDFHP